MSNKIKGLILISNVQKALEHEWFCEFVDKKEFDLEFVLFNSVSSDLYRFISDKGFKCKNYGLKSKFFIPVYVLFFSFKMLFKKYDFIHCHLFEASLIGLISSKIAGVKKRIYTRHHADFHHIYFPNAIKYDLLNNRLSTHIVAVSSNVKNILIERENVNNDKVFIIPHGIPASIINETVSLAEVDLIKKKYCIQNNQPIIGVVSRFTEWKGIQYIIPAFKKIVLDHPNAILVLANARGDYENQIKKMLSELPQNSFILIEFENNMRPLFKSFSMFIHTPIDKFCEAFGQVYIETLSLEVPMICTLSGIANDFIVNEENALTVNFKNIDDIYYAMNRLLNDEDLKKNIVRNGKNSVQVFSFEAKFEKLKKIYLE